jgi:Flp pilus assembly protein TadG
MIRAGRPQSGQAIVMGAFVIIVLCASVGLAVDAGTAYYYEAQAERAASAGALAGVIFMPDQFTPASARPAGSGNDATDRAIAEAKLNGFDPADTNNQVTVMPARVTGKNNQLAVTVGRRFRTSFMSIFGISSVNVSNTVTANYLRPIQLGQTGSQLGATVAQLGSGNNLYFMRTEGWATPRGEGDPYSPNPGTSTDVHKISNQNGVENPDTNLSNRGGYNYRIDMPSGGIIQVYNAAFSPDSSPHNYCDNYQSGSALQTCNSNGPSYYYHEEDGTNFSDATTYSGQRYTVYSVPNLFLRTDDVEVTQMTVLPIDARSWNSGNYRNVNDGLTITQTYDATGYPTNMLIYHNWIDVTTYTGPGDDGLVSYTAGYGPYAGTYLPPGTYRLRVDNVDYNGNPSATGSNPRGHKGYAVRALNTAGGVCTDCAVSSWVDLCLYSPSHGGTFAMQLFQLPPEYAGKTITIDIWDIGDISGAGTVTLAILNPSGAVATSTSPNVNISNIGSQRLPPAQNVTLYNGPNAQYVATDSTGAHCDNVWCRLVLPIPASYSPNPNDPTTWWWSLQYSSAVGTTSVDTFAVVVTFNGNPAHLVGG